MLVLILYQQRSCIFPTSCRLASEYGPRLRRLLRPLPEAEIRWSRRIGQPHGVDEAMSLATDPFVTPEAWLLGYSSI
jgi:hypothetical protein